MEENERAELKQIRGLKADNLEDALLEIQREAAVRPRLKNFMYHADFNPRPNEPFTEEDWERAFEIFEKQRGIPEGTPRVVYEHEKEGRVHRHVIWARLNPETMRAFPDGLDWKVAHIAAREIEKELGLQKTIGPLDREPGSPRPPRAPEPWEMYRAMKTGIDPRDIAAEVTELYRQSQNGQAFQAALELHGYELVTGRRGLLILDSAGKEHSLAKRIEGVNTAELNTFMRDVDRTTLPTVEQAKEHYQQRKIDALEADRATVRDEIEWEEKLAKAAIAKEEKERQFAEPQDRAKEQTVRNESSELHIASLSDRFFKDRDAYQYEMPLLYELAPDIAREVENRVTSRWANRESHIASLSDRYFKDFYAYQEEMPLLYEMAPDIAREVEYRVTSADRELIFKDNGPIDAPSREQANSGRQEKEQGPQPKPPAPELGKTQAEIRLARSLSSGPQSFANALEDRGYILAGITSDDIKRDIEQLQKEWEERRRHPQTWMEHEGGFAKLTPEFQESARRSFDQWKKENDRKKELDKQNATKENRQGNEQENEYKLEDYVEFVQKKWSQGPKSQLERAAGGLAVVTPFGSVYTLTSQNTGLDRDELPHYLQGIDRAPLLSVTKAQAVMQDVRDQRRDEWFYQRREEWSARHPLSKTNGEIRLAYSLTSTGQEFANALEDRGHILARMTATDAERLNRWERQRLKEEWKPPVPEKPGKAQAAERPAPDKYRVGELVVVNSYGQVFQLTLGNTGHDVAARAERLEDIDLAPLLSVTAAENVMGKYQHHRHEEWRQARQEDRQQKRDEWQRAINEKYAPTQPPQLKPGFGFEKVANAVTSDERTKDLSGPAAQVWAAWCQTDRDEVIAAALAGKTISFAVPTKEAFAASLDNRGISFAAVTKEEAERSHREAEFAKAIGNYAPRFKEGEIVIVTEQRPEYRRDGEIVEPARVRKLDQSLAGKFVKHLGTRSQLLGIVDTVKASDQRAQQRATDSSERAQQRVADREAIRDVYAASRLHRVRTTAAETVVRTGAANTRDAIHKSADAIGKTASIAASLGKVVDAIGNAAESLLAPKLTPQQIHDAEKAKDHREAEADFTIDFSRVTAEAAQQRQQQENEREAARQRTHGEGRERDR